MASLQDSIANLAIDAAPSADSEGHPHSPPYLAAMASNMNAPWARGDGTGTLEKLKMPVRIAQVKGFNRGDPDLVLVAIWVLSGTFADNYQFGLNSRGNRLLVDLVSDDEDAEEGAPFPYFFIDPENLFGAYQRADAMGQERRVFPVASSFMERLRDVFGRIKSNPRQQAIKLPCICDPHISPYSIPLDGGGSITPPNPDFIGIEPSAMADPDLNLEDAAIYTDFLEEIGVHRLAIVVLKKMNKTKKMKGIFTKGMMKSKRGGGGGNGTLRFGGKFSKEA